MRKCKYVSEMNVKMLNSYKFCFLLQNPVLYVYPIGVGTGKLSLFLADDMGTINEIDVELMSNSKHANCNVICEIKVKLLNSFKFSTSVFSSAESSFLRVPHEVDAGKTFTVSGR